MSDALNRAFKISDGLASIAGKKLKAAVSELQKEGVLTKEEGGKILSGMSKVKKNIYESVTKELKKVLSAAHKKSPAKKTSKKKRA